MERKQGKRLKLGKWVHGWYLRGIFRIGRGRDIHGVPVRVLWPESSHEELLARVEEALDLLATHSPKNLQWLRRFGRILVFGMEGPAGIWQGHARLVKLSEERVGNEEYHPAHIAATIVHETAHAWLDSRGIRYTPEKRRRIEAVCLRAEARFAGRIPGGEELKAYYTDFANRVLASSDEEWSDAAFRRRQVGRLVALDLPKWVLRTVGISEEEIDSASGKGQKNPEEN